MNALVVSEARVPVAPYQMVPGSDLTAMGVLGQGSLDNVVENILLAGVGYTGMTCNQVGTSNIIAVQPGWLVKGGPAYRLRDVFNVDVSAAINSVPDNAKTLLVAIVADGQEIPSSETRTFVDSSRLPTDPTQPAPTVTQPTPTRMVRSVVISSPKGAADIQPSLPSFSDSLCLIAVVRVSNTGIVSVSQNTATQITRLDQVAPIVAALNAQVGTFGPAIAGLQAALPALASLVAAKFTQYDALIRDIQTRLTAVELKLATPAASVFNWIDFFTDATQIQLGAAGASAKVGGGLTFAGNGTPSALAPFNPSSGLLELFGGRWLTFKRLPTSGPNSYINGFAYPRQANGQLVPITQVTAQMAYLSAWSTALHRASFGLCRIQVGASLAAIDASQVLLGGDPNTIWSQDGTGVGYTAPTTIGNVAGSFDWRRDYDPEITRQAGAYYSLTSHGSWGTHPEALTATGATNALNTPVVFNNSFNLAELFLSVKKGNFGDIRLLVCNDINGNPNPDSVITEATCHYADIGGGDTYAAYNGYYSPYNAKFTLEFPIPIVAGQKLHIVILTPGDHQVFLVVPTGDAKIDAVIVQQAQSQQARVYNNGSGWVPYGTTNYGMAMAMTGINPAFQGQYNLIELSPVTMVGGIDMVDVLTAVMLPKGQKLQLCIKLPSTNQYQLLTDFNGAVNYGILDYLATHPTTVQFALQCPQANAFPVIDTSIFKQSISKQGTDFNVPTITYSPGSSVTHITDNVIISGFDSGYETYAETLLTGAGYTTSTAPSTVVDKVQSDGTLLRTSTWNLGSGVTSFQIKRTGHTSDSTKQFTVKQAYGNAAP